MPNWNEHVFEHGALTQLVDGLWQVTGSLKRNPLPRNMTIWRDPDGGLVLHSLVCLDDDGMAAIDALGPVRHLLVPCRMHRADAAPYRARYPEARVLTPTVAQSAVEEVVAVDGTFEDCLPEVGICVYTPAGLAEFEVHLGVPLNDGRQALVMTDALFNLADSSPGGFGGFTLRLMGSVGPLGITRIGRWMLLKDRRGFRAYLEDLADAETWHVLTIAHGNPVIGDVGEALRAAARRL